MYFRTTTRKRGSKAYQSLHLVESYRTIQGKVKQRIVINFGSVHKYSPKDIKVIIAGLKKFFKIEEPKDKVIPPEASLDFGATYAIFRTWDKLGFSEIFDRLLYERRMGFNVVGNLKILIANRLLDPMAKLHVLDWLEGVHIPGIARQEITYNHLLRSMDFLIESKQVLEPRLATQILDLFDTKLNLVFYDVTSSYFEIDTADNKRDTPLSRGESSLRNFGFDRNHSGCPQVVLGLVMTRDGIPVSHHVFPGQTPDKSTLYNVISDLKRRFPVERCIFIGDRGLLSKVNLDVIVKAGFDFIVALPLRNNLVVKEVIRKLKPQITEQINKWEEKNTPFNKRHLYLDYVSSGRRFVLCHSDEIASQSQITRRKKLRKATVFIKHLENKLRLQAERPPRGRPLTDQGVLLKIHDYLRDHKLLRFYNIWLDDKKRFNWSHNRKVKNWERKIDGRLVLETTNQDISPDEVVEQYKGLQEIERCFRTLKSSLDMRPMFHWVDRRIRAHIFMCVIALQIERVMRNRLRAAKISKSPVRVLEKLSFQRSVEAKCEGKTIRGILKPTEEQLELFQALGLPTPKLRNLDNPNL